MDMLALSFVLSFASTSVVLYLLGRRDERRIRRHWQFLLSPRIEQIHGTIRKRLETELNLALMTYEQAFSVRGLDSPDEARRLLGVGYAIIEELSPSLLRLLDAMAVFSRMVSAIAPAAPLRPQAFQIGQIASLAYLNQILRHFLVTSTERFRLHAYILGRSLGVATRFLLNATRGILTNTPRPERHWKDVDAALEDFHALTDNSLECLRVLLLALDRERAEETFAALSEQPQTEDQPEFLTIGVWIAVAATVLLALQLLW
jgi:hypothetical protein